MREPTRAWHEEHEYFRRLLQLLQHELDRFACGETPNYSLMLDVICYLRDWSDVYHHPREDEVFRRLALLQPAERTAIARLQQEHRVIAAAGDSLRRLLEEVEAGGVVARSEIEVAAATYLVYYGNHIAAEEESILPLAAKSLSAQDWQAARDAAPSRSDPLFGDHPHERFSELRRRIALEAA